MESNNELKHYGVLGMKWGIHRARRKDAKTAYKRRTNRAFAEYEREINDIEKRYKGMKTLSKEDQAREAAAEKKYADAVSRAKADYKKAKHDKSNDAQIANRLYSKQSKGTNKAVANLSTGKAIAQAIALGSYGALKYNEVKSKGASKGRAVVVGMLHESANRLSAGGLATNKYLENVDARK